VPTVREILYQDIKGVSHRGIAQSLGVSRTTIKKYCDLAKSFGYNKMISDENLEAISLQVHTALYQKSSKRHQAAMLIIAPHHDRIKALLNDPWITHKQIHRLLTEDGIHTSPRSISRYIEQYFPKKIKSTVHLLTTAGEEAQVDYGYVGLINNKKTYAFVITLSHSRHRYVEFVHSQNIQSWVQSHINAFTFFGAVPRTIILDNLKSGVISSDIYDPTLNKTYSELATHYGFIADPAKARKPEHKGKVERSVQIVKEQIIAGRHFNNLDELNEFANNWCCNVISYEICSSIGRKPIDVFNNEDLPAMIPLTSEVFDIPIWTEAKIHQDHHFTLSGNFYSVPTEYIGQITQVRVGLRTVRVYKDHQLIKTHIKANGKGKWVTDQKDYPEYVAQYLSKGVDECLEAAKSVGEATFEFMQKILENSTKGALRKAQGILRLNDTYGSDRLESGCLRAIFFDNYEYKSLKKILDEKLDEKNTKTFSVKLPNEDINQGAYIRNAYEYSSSMEVNYG